jgi:hypothetical protein
MTERMVNGYKVQTLTEAEATDLFKQHLPLAQHHAAKFAAKYRIPLADVVDEAQSILGTTIAQWDSPHRPDHYNPECANPTSWLYRRIYWGLLTWCTRKQPEYKLFGGMGDACRPEQWAGREGWLDTFLHNLGDDARVVVRTLVAAPATIAADVGANKRTRTRKAVTGYLVQQGWATARVDRAFNEVAVAVFGGSIPLACEVSL